MLGWHRCSIGSHSIKRIFGCEESGAHIGLSTESALRACKVFERCGDAGDAVTSGIRSAALQAAGAGDRDDEQHTPGHAVELPWRGSAHQHTDGGRMLSLMRAGQPCNSGTVCTLQEGLLPRRSNVAADLWTTSVTVQISGFTSSCTDSALNQHFAYNPQKAQTLHLLNGQLTLLRNTAK